MRYTPLILSIGFLAGCAGSPPKPPEVVGDYRPVNKIEMKQAPMEKANTPEAISGTFDFSYSGDILGSLEALRAVQPQLVIQPTIGNVHPFPIVVNLRGTTLEQALKEIGRQGGTLVDVSLNKSVKKGGNKVHLMFRTPASAPVVENKQAIEIKPVQDFIGLETKPPSTPTNSDWSIRRSDKNIKALLERWAIESGWTFIWKDAPELQISADDVQTLTQPNFIAAADYVVSQANKKGYRLTGTAHSNKVLVITTGK